MFLGLAAKLNFKFSVSRAKTAESRDDSTHLTDSRIIFFNDDPGSFFWRSIDHRIRAEKSNGVIHSWTLLREQDRIERKEL